jgi:hypothetical protein
MNENDGVDPRISVCIILFKYIKLRGSFTLQISEIEEKPFMSSYNM